MLTMWPWLSEVHVVGSGWNGLSASCMLCAVLGTHACNWVYTALMEQKRLTAPGVLWEQSRYTGDSPGEESGQSPRRK